MLDNYLISFIGILVFAIFGVYIYFYKKSKINTKEIFNIFWISCGFRVLDILSTIYFTTRLGIDYEANVFARLLMYMFGIYAGLFISAAFLIPLSFFLFVGINYLTKGGNAWKLFKVFIILTGIVVPIINFASTNVYK